MAAGVFAVTVFALFMSSNTERYTGPFCFCVWPIYPLVETQPWGKIWGWTPLDAGPFGIYAPRGSTITRGSDELAIGYITFPSLDGFEYRFGPDVADPRLLGRSWTHIVERPVNVSGRQGVLITAEFSGSERPYWLSLYVPHVAQEEGQWLDLRIDGEFRMERDRVLGIQALQSLELEFMKAPPRPRPKPPAFDIAGPPA